MRLSLRKRYLILIGIFLVSITISLFFLYDKLGGNEELIIFESEDPEMIVVGRKFAGKQTSFLIEEYFMECRELIQSGQILGELTIINYESDTLDNNELSLFVGIAIEGSMAEIPVDFEALELEAEKKLTIFLSMHPIVRPTPATIKSTFETYLTQQGEKTTPLILEVHYPDNSMKVEAWLMQ